MAEESKWMDGEVFRCMTPEVYGGFRRMMNRWRKALNTPGVIDDLVNKGAAEIHLRNSERQFDRDGKFSHVASTWCRRVDFDKGRRYDPNLVRNGLEIIRNALNDKESFDILAAIGPESFILPDATEDKESCGEEYSSVGIHNFIPDCISNWDWSIKPSGEIWYHS